MATQLSRNGGFANFNPYETAVFTALGAGSVFAASKFATVPHIARMQSVNPQAYALNTEFVGNLLLAGPTIGATAIFDYYE